MNDILKLIDLCEEESDDNYSFSFNIDEYGGRIKGYYYSSPEMIPIYTFSTGFTKTFLINTAPGLDIYHYCKYEIDKFKHEVRGEEFKKKLENDLLIRTFSTPVVEEHKKEVERAFLKKEEEGKDGNN